jgi:hypothetical protein
MPNDLKKPTTYAGDLANLPRALRPLTEQKIWAVWGLERNGEKWTKPPRRAHSPDKYAHADKPETWADYQTAVAALGHKITRKDGQEVEIAGLSVAMAQLSGGDLDNCRELTGSIDPWAQNFLDVFRGYAEISPSGTGLRFLGEPGNGQYLHTQDAPIEISGKLIRVELFRCCNKFLTVTGAALNPAGALSNLDRALDWGADWLRRRKAEKCKAEHTGNGFDSSGCKYTIGEIDAIVAAGTPAGADRSSVFHSVVGHFVGVGWSADQLEDLLAQHPNGVAARYITEGRLRQEIERSLNKFGLSEQSADWTSGWVPPEESPPIAPEPEQPKQENPRLPPLYAHGDPDPRPIGSWLIKHLIPAVGHGLLSGQWGTGKTFLVFDLAAALVTGQPFLGYSVKRQCGVLLIAAEGGNQVRLRLDAVIREKCGGMARAPFRWYETAPTLLHNKNAVPDLIAMAEQANAALQAEFGLPLGLIAIDTISACAGYARAGEENDPAAGQAVMNVLKALSDALGCFVLGVDHYGKTVEAGTRGASSKEASADIVLAALGEKEPSGAVWNTRLAIRKNRGGEQGGEYDFSLRKVTALEPDEDGEPISTMVIDWSAPDAATTRAPPPDPWTECRRQDQQTAVSRLKRVLEEALADNGIEQPIKLDGAVVRMVDLELVREAFYAYTSAEGTPEQKTEFRRKRFNRALDWADDRRLITVHEIGGVTYLWLSRPDLEGDELED